MLHRLIFICLAAVLLAGCISDNCTAVRCLNEGVCVQGACACAYGYEGELCGGKWYDKFNRQWTAAETVNTDTVRTYPLSIMPGNSPDTFYVFGLAQLADTVVCTRKAYRVFTMHERILPDSSKISGGEGVYNPESGIVTGMYSFSKGDVITNVRFTWYD